MTVHIGQLTSEVWNTAPPDPPPPAAGPTTTSRWERELEVASALARVTLDRLRTATGPER